VASQFAGYVIHLRWLVELSFYMDAGKNSK
jgi:hypothetical protein